MGFVPLLILPELISYLGVNMKIMNSNMEKYYFHQKNVEISPRLLELLDIGFTRNKQNIFFTKFSNIDDLVVIKRDLDATGSECNVNSFHLEDYVDKPFENYYEVANASFSFINEFLQRWNNEFSDTCVLILSMDEDSDFSPDAVFRFHKKRDGEVWIDPSELGNFANQAIFICSNLDVDC